MLRLRGRAAGFAAGLAALSAAGSAAVLPAVAHAGTGTPAGTPPACTAAHTETWVGLGEGGGTFLTIYYPVEFSNVGTKACVLSGYPAVTAVGPSGHRVGPASSHAGPKRPVTLQPGQTAHVVLGIRIASTVQGCSVVHGASLKVVPPRQADGPVIPDFSFDACSNKAFLSVDAVHRGTGIPGYSIH